MGNEFRKRQQMSQQERRERLKYGFEHNGQTMPDPTPVPKTYETLPSSDDQWARVQAKLAEIAARGRQVENPEELNAQAIDQYRNTGGGMPVVYERMKQMQPTSVVPEDTMEGSEMTPETAAKIRALKKMRGF